MASTTLCTDMAIFGAAALMVASWSLFERAIAVPSSKCYALDRNNYLYDFTDMVGRELELEGKGSDLVLRFCVDVQNRSQNGYISYGRFSSQNPFTHGLGGTDFLQVYNNGDLMRCEHNGFGFTGHEAHVSIICGSCFSGFSCSNGFGCICNATYYQNQCRVDVTAAINCSGRGHRIVPGFSIGFKPGGSEVVGNGLPQWDFHQPFHNYSFATTQKKLSLYLTTRSFPVMIKGKPGLHVRPDEGLAVSMSWTYVTAAALLPRSLEILEVNWKCVIPRQEPYEVQVAIPIEGYEPVNFFLCKLCGLLALCIKSLIRTRLMVIFSTENQDKDEASGSIALRVLVFLLVVITSCLAVYWYKRAHGMETFPALGFLAHCLQRVRRDVGDSYKPLDLISDF